MCDIKWKLLKEAALNNKRNYYNSRYEAVNEYVIRMDVSLNSEKFLFTNPILIFDLKQSEKGQRAKQWIQNHKDIINIALTSLHWDYLKFTKIEIGENDIVDSTSGELVLSDGSRKDLKVWGPWQGWRSRFRTVFWFWLSISQMVNGNYDTVFIRYWYKAIPFFGRLYQMLKEVYGVHTDGISNRKWTMSWGDWDRRCRELYVAEEERKLQNGELVVVYGAQVQYWQADSEKRHYERAMARTERLKKCNRRAPRGLQTPPSSEDESSEDESENTNNDTVMTTGQR